MKTITFYSYKGGVGRSLALVNIATRLVEFGKKVCVLDFDLEAPGLHLKFPLHEFGEDDKGIVDYLYEFSSKGIVEKSMEEYTYHINLGKRGESLQLIPAGNPDSSNYWRKLSSINWFEMIYENPNGLAFFLNLKESIKRDFNPDFLLIDSRTGISEMSGVSLSLLADEVVIVAANNKENLGGARRVIKSLFSNENNILNKVPNVHFVLSRIPFTNKPEDKAKEAQLLNKILREYLTPYINEINVIHSDRELEEVEKIKIAYVNDDSNTQISVDYLKLFEKITKPYLTNEEISKFNNIREAEQFISLAYIDNPIHIKIDFVSKALELIPDNPDFYVFRASLYYNNEQWEEAYRDATKALTLFENHYDALLIQIYIHYKRNEYKQAAEKAIYLLNVNPDNYFGLLLYSSILVKRNSLKEAIDVCNLFLHYYPEQSLGYSTRGNVFRVLKNFEKAKEDVYKALEIDSNNVQAIATLAEIYAELGILNEFYVHLENALKIDSFFVKNAIKDEEIYLQFRNVLRFNQLLDKYNVSLD